MQLEDPPKPTGGNTTTAAKKDPEVNDDFDDVMFDMSAPNTKSGAAKGKSQPPMTPSTGVNSLYKNEQGQEKDSWFREEEVMRKKLEKGAIHQLKTRIAQQNR